jgi:hypothetical protein
MFSRIFLKIASRLWLTCSNLLRVSALAKKLTLSRWVWNQFADIIDHLHAYELSISTAELQKRIDQWSELLLGSRLPKASESISGIFTWTSFKKGDSCLAETIFGVFLYSVYMYILVTHVLHYFTLFGSLRIGECQRGENQNSALRRCLKNTKQSETLFADVLSWQLTTAIVSKTEKSAPITDSSRVCDVCSLSFGNPGTFKRSIKRQKTNVLLGLFPVFVKWNPA